MKALINDDWTINQHKYFYIDNKKNKGKKLKISGTKDNGRLPYTIDIIKNLETGKCIELERCQLKNLKPYIVLSE